MHQTKGTSNSALRYPIRVLLSKRLATMGQTYYMETIEETTR